MKELAWDTFHQVICQHVITNTIRSADIENNLKKNLEHLEFSKLFYQLIDAHRLDFIFLPFLKESDPLFTEHCSRKIHQHLKMKQCLLEVTCLFSMEKIPYVVLKGITLNKQLYGKSCLRRSNDIDLFIQEKDLLRAHACLMSAGFNLNFAMTPQKIIENYPFLMQAMKDFHYTRPLQQFCIELHWQATRMPSLTFNPFAHDHIISLSLLNGQSISILDHENNFLYLCIHAAFHNWQRLQWLVDIAMFWKTIPLSWPRIILLAKECGAIRHLLEAKILLEDQFNIILCPIPHSIADNFFVKFRIRHAKKYWRNPVLKPMTEIFYSTLIYASLRQKWQYLAGLILQGKTSLQQLLENPNNTKNKLLLHYCTHFFARKK